MTVKNEVLLHIVTKALLKFDSAIQAKMTDSKCNTDYIILQAFIYYLVFYFYNVTSTLTNYQTSGRLLSYLKQQHSLRIHLYSSSAKFNLLTNLTP